MRKVVVTGLGAVTPLGLGSFIMRLLGLKLTFIGVRRSWKRLIDGECGIESISSRGPAFQKLKCQVAGIIPQGSKDEGSWSVSEWLSRNVRICNDF